MPSYRTALVVSGLAGALLAGSLVVAGCKGSDDTEAGPWPVADTGPAAPDAAAGDTPPPVDVPPPADVAGPPDGAGWPDTAGPTDSTEPEDGSPDLVQPDLTLSDLALSDLPLPDVPGGPDPFAPVQPCMTGKPCLDGFASLCLLLPGQEEGFCVHPCSKDDPVSCPPWLECVTVDSSEGQVTLAVCSKVAALNEPCAPEEGIVCGAGYYCVSVPGSSERVCTWFCDTADAVCHPGTSCQVVDSEDPEADWGACLEKPALAPCGTGDACADSGHTCVTIGPGSAACAAACGQAGKSCEGFGTCVEQATPAGGKASVCMDVQDPEEICDPSKGLPCAGAYLCTDIGAPDGWKRCVLPCPGGTCPAGGVCSTPAGSAAAVCISYTYALDYVVPCNDGWPCTAGETTCVKKAAASDGVCVAPCDEGCLGGSSCYMGGCVHLAPAGTQCLEDKAVFCQPPAECLLDGVAEGAGYCALPCSPGEGGCGEGEACVETSKGEHHCLEPAAYVEPCSLDDGVGCDPSAGLTCLHVSTEADDGFCTSPCEGPGSACPAGPPGTSAQCVLNHGGKWYCALLCGAFGPCPDGMTCAGMGMCLP